MRLKRPATLKAMPFAIGTFIFYKGWKTWRL
jgi:hypothetical protein